MHLILSSFPVCLSVFHRSLVIFLQKYATLSGSAIRKFVHGLTSQAQNFYFHDKIVLILSRFMCWPNCMSINLCTRKLDLNKCFKFVIRWYHLGRSGTAVWAIDSVSIGCISLAQNISSHQKRLEIVSFSLKWFVDNIQITHEQIVFITMSPVFLLKISCLEIRLGNVLRR